MNLLALILSFIFAFQATCAPIAHAAAETNVAIDSSARAQAKCNKVGALLLADGLAIMSGDSVEVTGNPNGGSPQNQLSGVLFKKESLSGNSFKAWAFFNSGVGLSKVTSKSCPERVELTDGTKLSGPISSITPTQVVTAAQTVPMSSVSSIHSSRVFQFTYKGGASSLNFQPTCVHAAGGGSKNITTKQVVIGLLIAVVIATAIAVPVAVCCSQHHHTYSPPVTSSNSSQNVTPRMPSFVTLPRRFPRTSSSSSSSSSSNSASISTGPPRGDSNGG